MYFGRGGTHWCYPHLSLRTYRPLEETTPEVHALVLHDVRHGDRYILTVVHGEYARGALLAATVAGNVLNLPQIGIPPFPFHRFKARSPYGFGRRGGPGREFNWSHDNYFCSLEEYSVSNFGTSRRVVRLRDNGRHWAAEQGGRRRRRKRKSMVGGIVPTIDMVVPIRMF